MRSLADPKADAVFKIVFEHLKAAPCKSLAYELLATKVNEARGECKRLLGGSKM
jgi:hypothetical protein